MAETSTPYDLVQAVPELLKSLFVPDAASRRDSRRTENRFRARAMLQRYEKLHGIALRQHECGICAIDLRHWQSRRG
jgi:hypothetical protein